MNELNTIEEALEDIKAGKVIIVVDDEDRENEGDFVCAARHASPEVINFMATHGRGLICAPLVEERCDELGLDLMVSSNSAAFETPFTVSVDLIGHGCTTGISASDRSKTVLALIDEYTDPKELGKPGHIFPLRAKNGGVLRRMGHTEAAVDLSRMSGFEPAGVIVEIMNEDGTMARLPQLLEIAEKHSLKIISIEDLIEYRLKNESLIEKKINFQLPTKYGNFELFAFEQTTTGDIHLALKKGEVKVDAEIPVRVHSSTLTHDLFGAISDYEGPTISDTLKLLSDWDNGVLVLMNQQRKDENIIAQLEAYKDAINEGKANIASSLKMDKKDYGVGAQILREMGVRKIKLITSSDRKTGPIGYGLEITSIEKCFAHELA